ncbi:unnamed protein product [Diabrotica balteata]|uniref:Uncharacterized protein n=1 Tax=Diabrotica balteata TaxID=107213 RepID=A0A9N9XG45_DIABA|nr:unnamed protein product [Diabrotica balteata]
MFLNTFVISETFVSTELKKISDGGTIEADKKGKHRPHKIPDSVKDNILEHIKLFPLVPSHYTRRNSKRMHLEEGLNISVMHRMYVEYAKLKKWDAVAIVREYRKVTTLA